LSKALPVEAEWVDYPTAARFGSLSHTTFWRYVGSGELIAARVGRSVRIHLATLKRSGRHARPVSESNKGAFLSYRCLEDRCFASQW
jgi:hypothetical protein